MTTIDRRRSERLLLVPPLSGRIEGREVVVREIGLLGSRIEHDDPVVAPGPARLTLEWDGEEITVDCTVTRSERLGVDGDERRFSSGVSFSRDLPTLRKLVASLAAREEIERLRTIVEASKLINSSIEAESLFGSILAVARNELGVERGTLYFVDEQRGEIWSKTGDGLEAREIRLPMGKGIAGSVAAGGEPVIILDAYDDPRFDRSADQRSGFRTKSMLCTAIRNKDGRIVGVLQLLNKRQGSFGPRDIEFLDAISDHMAIAMENATLHLERIEKNRMERDLQLGREIQSRLLAKPPSDVTGTQLVACNVPCFEVGGDYYDFIEFSNGDLGIAVADVSGKGVGAALIMSSVQAALRVAAPLESDLASLMTRLNALLFRMASGRKYATFFFGRYTPSTGSLRYVNAGHCLPFLVGDASVQTLETSGRPIGILPDGSYVEYSATVDRGATLFLYTDGLSEAANCDEEEFGTGRLEQLVARSVSEGVDGLSERILAAIAEFEQGAPVADDKTIVALRRL